MKCVNPDLHLSAPISYITYISHLSVRSAVSYMCQAIWTGHLQIQCSRQCLGWRTSNGVEEHAEAEGQESSPAHMGPHSRRIPSACFERSGTGPNWAVTMTAGNLRGAVNHLTGVIGTRMRARSNVSETDDRWPFRLMSCGGTGGQFLGGSAG